MADEQQPDDNPHPMSQDEIDALFEALANDMPEEAVKGTTEQHASKIAKPPALDAEAPAEPGDAPEPAPEEEAEAPAEPGDAVAETGTEPVAADTEASEPQQESTESPPEDTAAAAAPAAAPAGDAGGAMSQDDIDALLAEMGGEEESASAPADEPQADPSEAPAAAAPAGDAGGAMSQDDIDALLAEMGGEEESESAEEEQAPVAEAVTPAAETPAADAGGAMSQNDIDSLLAEMGVDDGSSAQNANTESEAGTAGSAAASAEDEAQGDAGGAMSQADIDALLADMGVSKEEGHEALAGHDTERLSTQQIANIIDKQTSHAEPEPEGSSESMISQDDIDALVRQMSEATVVPEEEHTEGLLDGQTQDIEALLEEAQRGGEATDAVQGSLVPVAHPPVQQSVFPGHAAVMDPEELRGTRYLLVAAVFFLAMCTMTMVFVANAINGLTGELRRGRSDEVEPQDSFDKDVAVALDFLAQEDDFEVQKGLRYFERIKRDYRRRLPEIAMLLARHHRSRQAWARAIDEYRLVVEHQGDYIEDPQFYLEYSDSLYQLGEYGLAREVLLRLLANESRFAREHDDQGTTRTAAMIQSEREALQRAYLMLGRIYTAQLETLPSPRQGEGA